MLLTSLGVYADSYKVNAKSGLNVRNGASASAQVIGRLDNGDITEVESIVGEWAKIEYRGKTAYVSMNYLQPYSKNLSQASTSGKTQSGIFLPLFIFVLSIATGWLWGNEYFWCALAATVVLLISVWYQLSCTYMPLWFLTERGVGFGMMVVNMFLTFACLMVIWNCIAATMMFLCVDKITVWCAKVLFVLTVFAPGNNLIVLVILWGIGVAIYRSIKESEVVLFLLALVGLTLCGVVVMFGGELCGKVFNGFDAFILVVAAFPQLLECAAAFDGSSSSRSNDGLKRYTIIDNNGHEINLTQNSRCSACDFTDQDGNPYTKDSQGFHRNY